MTADVLDRDGLPPQVFQRHTSAVVNGLELHVDTRPILRAEAALTPLEGQPLARNPRQNASDFEGIPRGFGVNLQQPSIRVTRRPKLMIATPLYCS
jgi:hypothetical protein